MVGILSQASKCLYCVWPALVGGIGWWLCRIIEHKTYYGALTVGVDPVSPQGQEEFNTRRLRDKEKRHTIYWMVGIIVCGYLIALLWNTFTIKTKAAPALTPFPSPSLASTLTSTSSLLPVTPSASALPQAFTLTSGPTTPTQTPTARVVHVAGPQVTVIVTRIVTVVVTKKPTKIPTPTFTLTPTYTDTSSVTPTMTPTCIPSLTPSPTGTLEITETPTETFTPSPTGSETETITPTLEPCHE